MVRLTLTHCERATFELVAGRYATGHEVVDLLRTCLPDEVKWEDRGDLTFEIPPDVSRMLFDLSATENHMWPLFDASLKEKMNRACKPE